MTNKFPTFSILIPAYNAAATLHVAIRSCIDQSETPLEIIVGNDGSDDETLNIANSFGAAITIVSHSNVGQSATLNRLAEQARGDYLVLLDADDWNAPTRLASLRRHILNHPAEIVTHDAWHVYPERPARRHYELVNWHEANQLSHLLRSNFVFGNPAIRRDTWRSLGGLDEALHLGEDYDLWVRALSAGLHISLCAEPLYFYRCHPLSKTSDRTRTLGLEEHVIQRLLTQPDLTPAIRRSMESALKWRSRKSAEAWRNLDAAQERGGPASRRDLWFVFAYPGSGMRARLKALGSLVVPALWDQSLSAPRMPFSRRSESDE